MVRISINDSFQFFLRSLQLSVGDKEDRVEELIVYGFRVGGLGYITDGKRLPPATLEALRGVDVLVLNALWFGRPHAAHFNVEEAVEAARAVGARRTFLTHITHRVSHAELLERLPDGVAPAYDGLTVEVEHA